jgi:glycosyltransferase involved in cell wall biosynthesis
VRLLHVTSSYPKRPGDVTAPFVESIARALVARGHTIDMVLPYHPDLARPDEPGIRFFPYRYAPRESWNLWGYAQSLESDVRVRRAIYGVLPFAALALRRAVSGRLNAALVTDLVRAHRAPYVVSLHGSDVFMAERLRPARALAGRAFAAAGAVTACSVDLHRRALLLGAAAERTHTVPYGVDVQAFAPRPPAPEVRARLGVPADAFLVLGVGRLVEKKGFAHLVEAAAKTGGVRVVIAGDGDLRGPLEAQARAAGAPVSFPGALPRDLVAAALAEADVVVVPSVVDAAGNVDGLPNVLLEAMACGRPLVASRTAGIPDVIDDGANGLLVPEKDPRALAEALRLLLREPALRARLGEEARKTAVRTLSWDVAARRFEEGYAQAAALDAR